MQRLGNWPVDPWPYEYAYEPVKPGLWRVDVDMPRRRLQLQDVMIVARTEEEMEQQLYYRLQLILARMLNPPRAVWN